MEPKLLLLVALALVAISSSASGTPKYHCYVRNYFLILREFSPISNDTDCTNTIISYVVT